MEWNFPLKKTKQRELVFALLQEVDTPLTAAAIYQHVVQQDANISLSTIYRILDAFVTHGIVLKNVLANQDMALYEIKGHQHHHYATCLSCHTITSIHHCPMDSYHLEEEQFTVTGHSIELFGYCKNCAHKA